MSSSSNKFCEFNNHINLILLIMFVMVVLVVLGFKCCTLSLQDKNIDFEMVHQSDTLCKKINNN